MTLRKTLACILCPFGLPSVSVGLLLAGFCGQVLAASPSDRVEVAGSVPVAKFAAQPLGRLSQTAPMAVTLTLPLHHQAELEALLSRLSNPTDPAYGHYLTPEEFAARFSPAQADYDAVSQYARRQGLTVTGRHANRLLLDVAGPVTAIESAFHVRLHRYRTADGRVFHAPDAAPSVDRSMAGIVMGVAGLSDAAIRRPHNRRHVLTRRAMTEPRSGGNGPQGGLTPADIQAAYNLTGMSLNGSGQTMALFEQDGYDPGDIAVYESQFHLPSVPLQNILLGSVSGEAGSNADEVTLDIEMQIALAPGVRQILVYEAGAANNEVLDGYSRIAEDDQAKEISTSWGLDEPDSDAGTLQSENAIFEQMAAQGQTIYASAGDNGAYDTGSQSDGLTVDDPASQPFVCGVGGTSLTTNGRGGSYVSETTWNTGSVQNGAGGGGISRVWPIPSWQQVAISSASRGSTTMRNVPDVSLNADPNTGYSIYTQGAWIVYGGTSCAAPLWAGFTALVNQQRTAQGLSPLGQAAPALYPLLKTASYTADFHDIADGSTNLYYSAVTGYDEATGLGTFNGARLLSALAAGTPYATHALWTNTDGRASVWNYDTSGGTFTQNTYGPYANWSATALADGGDGLTRILWDRTDGTASIWSLDNTRGVFTFYNFGPYPGWIAKSLSLGPSSIMHVLWTSTSRQASIWNYDTLTSTDTYQNYGPYTGYTAKAIADGPDGKTRVLWNKTDGTASIWSLDNTRGVFTFYNFGPYPDWTAQTLCSGPDNTTHVLWTNTDGRASVWNYDTSGGTFTQNTYGPYANWSATALADGGDGLTRILWDRTDGAASIWNLNNATGSFTQGSFGPYAGWTAAMLSVASP